MNLRDADGKVPVYTGHPTTPYTLVEFPTFQGYCSLYKRKVKAELLYKYYNILERRRDGMTLLDAGRPHHMTKERVRQIEAKFLRLMREAHEAGSSSTKGQLEKSHS
jgi:hypothetical protein